jgi:hypothetical protein
MEDLAGKVLPRSFLETAEGATGLRNAETNDCEQDSHLDDREEIVDENTASSREDVQQNNASKGANCYAHCTATRRRMRASFQWIVGATGYHDLNGKGDGVASRVSITGSWWMGSELRTYPVRLYNRMNMAANVQVVLYFGVGNMNSSWNLSAGRSKLTERSHEVLLTTRSWDTSRLGLTLDSSLWHGQGTL